MYTPDYFITVRGHRWR